MRKTDPGRLILHIGTHKTGTTSFQASLRQNAQALRARGLLAVPEPNLQRWLARKQRYNLGKLAQGFLAPGVASVARLRAGELSPDMRPFLKLRARVLSRIRRAKQPAVLLTAEGFSFLRRPEEAEALRAFLDATGRKVEIIVVFRNDADWRASWTNQLKKFKGAWKRNKRLPDDRRANGEWYFDRDSLLAFWQQFGEVRVLDYDAALAADGNILPTLYRALGVDTTGLKLDFDRNQRVDLDDGAG